MRKRFVLIAAIVAAAVLGGWGGVAYATTTQTDLQSKSISVSSTMVSNTTSYANAGSYLATATCPAGYDVSGGGGQVNNSGNTDQRPLKASIPTDVNQWGIRFDAQSGDTAYVYVLCLAIG